MDQYTPPTVNEPTVKPRFFASLWKTTAILQFLSIPLLAAITYFNSRGPVSSYSTGYIIGASVSAVLWSLLLGFIIFLLSKRSALAANVTCLIVVGLISFGNLITLAGSALGTKTSETRSNDQALAALGEKMKAHRAEGRAFLQAETIDQDAMAEHGAQGLEIIREAIPTFRGPLRETLQNFVDSTDRMNENSADYDREYIRFEQEALAPMIDGEDTASLDRRIAIVRDWMKANEKLRDAVQQWSKLEELKENLETEQEKAFARGLTLSMMRQSPALMIIRDTDDELGEAFVGVFELHKQENSKYTAQGGALNTTFESPDAQARLKQYIADITDASNRQEQAQRTLLSQ